MSVTHTQYQAIRLAIKAHDGQLDKAGEDYIHHPIAVAANMKEDGYDSDDILAVAVLHDVVEDTDTTIELIQKLFGDTISQAVKAITKRDGEKYKDYLKRVKGNEIAHIVKLYDIAHNLSPARMCHLKTETRKRLVTKYTNALYYLHS